MMEKLKSTVMSHAMKVMTDPKVMKLLSNPKVSQAVMQGFLLKGRLDELWRERSVAIARRLNLATLEELDALKAEVARLRAQKD